MPWRRLAVAPETTRQTMNRRRQFCRQDDKGGCRQIPDIWAVSDATTNALHDLATFSKNSTGAGAAGLGRTNQSGRKVQHDDRHVAGRSVCVVGRCHACYSEGPIHAYGPLTRQVCGKEFVLRRTVRRYCSDFTEAMRLPNRRHLTATVAAAPAGGTGTAAGGWDTSGNRDLAIATINNLKTRVDQLETKLQALGLLT